MENTLDPKVDAEQTKGISLIPPRNLFVRLSVIGVTGLLILLSILAYQELLSVVILLSILSVLTAFAVIGMYYYTMAVERFVKSVTDEFNVLYKEVSGIQDNYVLLDRRMLEMVADQASARTDIELSLEKHESAEPVLLQLQEKADSVETTLSSVQEQLDKHKEEIELSFNKIEEQVPVFQELQEKTLKISNDVDSINTEVSGVVKRVAWSEEQHNASHPILGNAKKAFTEIESLKKSNRSILDSYKELENKITIIEHSHTDVKRGLHDKDEVLKALRDYLNIIYSGGKDERLSSDTELPQADEETESQDFINKLPNN